MNAVQIHRGPDSSGEWRDRDLDVALAMRRLAIVDLSEGVQPMVDEGERHVLVFNGEIFNAPALRLELEREGQRFRTDHSDTEVILNGYRSWGERIVDRLNGMFAFVIYDRDRRTLFGARDPAGIKPLYIFHRGEQLAFASELKSFFELPWLSRSTEAVDIESLSHYLTLQFIPSPRTILRDVQKVPAAHCFQFSLSNAVLSFRRYWAPPAPTSTNWTRSAAVAGVQRHLESAVRRWLMSDVPMGCSLSGGIDSAAVVGIMADLGISPIRTWTLGFTESTPLDDERSLARLVAKRYQTQHTEVLISAEEVLTDLPRMVQHLDEPYAGGLPSWYIFRAMHGQVKVAMTGTGGDELFGNYDKWRAFDLLTRLGLKRVVRAVNDYGWSRLIRNWHGARYHGYLGDGKKEFLISRALLPVASTATLIERSWISARRRDPKDAVAAVDFQLQLPDEFLHMTDRFSMAWSIEARTPFLDRELMEYALALPTDIRIDSRRYKGLLREAVSRWVPRELLMAGKRGFTLPLAAWTRGALRPLLEDLLHPRYLRDQGLFEPEFVRDLLAGQFAERQEATDLVWALLMFQLWWRAFLSSTDRSGREESASCG